MVVDRIEPLGSKEDMRLKGALEIRLGTMEPPIEGIQEVLGKHSGDSRVRFLLKDRDGSARSIRAGKEWSVELSSQLIDDLNRLLGPDCALAVMERGVVEREQRPAWSRS
jgi:hypothetical protein